MNEELGDRQFVLGANKEARARWEIARALFAELKSKDATGASVRLAGKLAGVNKAHAKAKN